MPIIRTEKREIKLKRPLAEISPSEFRRGLTVAPTFAWFPKAVIEGAEALPEVEAAAPLYTGEIVPWMQEAAAYNIALEGMCEDYQQAGSMLVSRVGDGLIPGVGVGSGTKSAKFTSVSATTVAGQRGAYFTAGGRSFFCPEYGKLTAITKDFLAWAAIPGIFAYQWFAALLAFLDLASTPINNRIRFASLKGLTVPNFVIVRSQYFPPPALTMHIGLTSNKAQVVGIQFRSSGNYTDVLASDSLDVPAGESTVDYFVACPGVTEFVCHLQPEDRTETVLDSLTMTPP